MNEEGMMFRLNENGKFEEYKEPYCVIECLEKEDYDHIVEMVEKGEKMRWIPVTERLPEKVGYYIVWDKYAKVPYTLWYHDFYDREFADGLPQRYFGNASNQAKYTHWMPLPDAPEEETNV